MFLHLLYFLDFQLERFVHRRDLQPSPTVIILGHFSQNQVGDAESDIDKRIHEDSNHSNVVDVARFNEHDHF